MDYRLARLNYNISFADESKTVVPDANEIQVTFGAFDCTVSASELVAIPTDDFESADVARAQLEPHLDAWAATSELFDRFPMKFTYSSESFEYVGPPNPHQTVAFAGVAMATVAVGEVTVHIQRSDLPPPKPGIGSVGALAAQLRQRWRNMEEGRESVTGTTYFIATAVKKYIGAGKPHEALNISKKILDDMQRLSSVADPEHGRKADGHSGTLTADQLTWMKHACLLVVQRVLAYEAGADISRQLTKNDLPPLDEM